MYLHREGTTIIISSFVLLAALALTTGYYFDFSGIVYWLVMAFCLVMFFLVVQFFRVPKRKANLQHQKIISPADGKLVVIERIVEQEYFNDERIQLSIFMSPLNVHVNWYPAAGKVSYVRYHPGKYLVAWDPKSSTENERTTVVVNTGNEEIMIRQIAGAVARRIVCYAKQGDEVKQGQEMGFIKFGSRVDVILPLTANVEAVLNQATQGLLTELASL